jgi:hypothetical protein
VNTELGCPSFFRYHPNATLQEYSQRFGFDEEILKQTLMQAEFYKNNGQRRETNEDNVFRQILLELDKRDLTDVLYGQQKANAESSYLQHSNFLNVNKNIFADFRIVFERYTSKDDEPDDDQGYDLYPQEDPYKMFSEIVGLLDSGYSIYEIVKKIEENMPEKELTPKIVELVNLLNILRNKKICPMCGSEICNGEDSGIDFCMLCGNVLDDNSLELIKSLPKEELMGPSIKIEPSTIK